MKNPRITYSSSLLALCAVLSVSCIQPVNKKSHTNSMITISKTHFGQTDGKDIDLYTISGKEMTVKITNFGGIVTSIIVPDREGKLVGARVHRFG